MFGKTIDRMTYTNVNSDPVCFNPIQLGKIQAEVRNICFAQYLERNKDTKKPGFICKDPAHKSTFEEEHYIQWMELCRQHGLVATEAVVYREDDRNCLYVEEGAYDYPVLYASLCCFRWTTHYAKMCHQLVNDHRNISFHQKLHYALSTTASNWNHSFNYLSTANGTYTYNGVEWNRALQSSVGWNLFYNHLTPDERAKWAEADRSKQKMANVAIEQFAAARLPSMLVPKVADVEQERWRPLYEMGDVGKEKFAQVFKQCR